MNCGFTQVRLWSKEKAQIEKAVAEANAAARNVLSASEYWRGLPMEDFYGVAFLANCEGKTWQGREDKWVPNGRALFVAETHLCERYDLLGMLEEQLAVAAKANGVVIASFDADPDRLHGIDALFTNWVETASFKFSDNETNWDFAFWLMGRDLEEASV